MDSLFLRILKSPDVFYKHLKMEEDDLTDDEKLVILKNLAENNVSLFLTRYEKYLAPNDCSLFEKCDDSFVQLMLRKIGSTKPSNSRNQRFVMMQNLVENGDYFSDIKMRQREPYLFDAMIGKFLNEEERIELRPTVSREDGQCVWSDMLDRFAESSEIAQRRNAQEYEYTKDSSRPDRLLAHVSNRINDEEFVPEEDEEEEEDEIEKLRKEMERLSKLEADQYNDLDENETPQLLRQEFENYMRQRFLAGKDKEFFDYSKCENFIDPIEDRDIEEKWFDED